MKKLKKVLGVTGLSAIVAFGGGCAIVNFLGKPVYVKNGGVKVDYLGKVMKTKYPVIFFLLLYF